MAGRAREGAFSFVCTALFLPSLIFSVIFDAFPLFIPLVFVFRSYGFSYLAHPRNTVSQSSATPESWRVLVRSGRVLLAGAHRLCSRSSVRHPLFRHRSHGFSSTAHPAQLYPTHRRPPCHNASPLCHLATTQRPSHVIGVLSLSSTCASALVQRRVRQV